MRCITFLLATLAVSPALAQTLEFYGADGSYRGTMMPSGRNARAFYDGDGNYAGIAMRAGQGVMLYDAQGNYAGMATNSAGAMMGDE